ncbi:S8 family serine peptidase [Amorphoplanes digitatis]|uniref:Type VII secretion-associated serine protease mycosin n=1 Tax=Actinoplanes digitatis TaxID=1868 RepID=A0A7W7MU62_9ACTN|nr:S8 family serine peptidase [Actinoplanes digitatis]MBB4766249.1 type VII secretion-associated serine protease mycosin [Actinoplanes digitatis]GID95978.1 type VII secretion-associated serine protease [Actinoplanes digitatis]
MQEAHRSTKGAGITVAVIDSGVWAAHPDLKGAVLPGFDVLGKGDGRDDLEGHGTQMAGVIAGRGRSGGNGVLGIAPAAKILPVSPAGSPLVVSKAIDWAVEHGATVINMSFLTVGSDGLAVAIKKAAEADVVLVAGAGNGHEADADSVYPAAYPEVIAVGATDRAGKHASFSREGPQLDLSAPGADVVVANGDEGKPYERVEGTSVSAAIVSGAAALIRSEYPGLTAAQVVQALEAAAVDKGPAGRDDAYGYGELDLVAALDVAASLTPGSAASASTGTPPISGPEEDDSGIPPVAIAGIGVLVVAGVGVVLAFARRRSRSG